MAFSLMCLCLTMRILISLSNDTDHSAIYPRSGDFRPPFTSTM